MKLTKAKRSVKSKWRVGDRVEIPNVSGRKFAGLTMQQDPRNVGKTGTIIWFEYIGGVRSPVIRLDGKTQRVIHGYECWWRLIR